MAPARMRQRSARYQGKTSSQHPRHATKMPTGPSAPSGDWYSWSRMRRASHAAQTQLAGSNSSDSGTPVTASTRPTTTRATTTARTAAIMGMVWLYVAVGRSEHVTEREVPAQRAARRAVADVEAHRSHRQHIAKPSAEG